MIFLLGYLWALPTTLIGATVALFTLSKPYGFRDGAILCKAGGLMRLLLEKDHFAAQTHGAVIFVRADHIGKEPLLRHELVHFAQARKWGPFFLPAYGLASLWLFLRKKDAYWDNPFEVEARKLTGETK
jgi:hypothetical protein